jgi:hypothetical protein
VANEGKDLNGPKGEKAEKLTQVGLRKLDPVIDILAPASNVFMVKVNLSEHYPEWA